MSAVILAAMKCSSQDSWPIAMVAAVGMICLTLIFLGWLWLAGKDGDV